MTQVNVRSYQRNGQTVSAHERGMKPKIYRRFIRDYEEDRQQKIEMETANNVNDSWVQKYADRISEYWAKRKRDRNIMASLPYSKQIGVHALRLKDWWNNNG